MNAANDQIRQMILQALRATFTEDIVIPVPQGVAVLSTDGRHTLVRVDDAVLEVTR